MIIPTCCYKLEKWNFRLIDTFLSQQFLKKDSNYHLKDFELEDVAFNFKYTL
jgi:hypothetical protein